MAASTVSRNSLVKWHNQAITLIDLSVGRQRLSVLALDCNWLVEALSNTSIELRISVLVFPRLERLRWGIKHSRTPSVRCSLKGPLTSDAIARKVHISVAIVLIELVQLAREGLVSMKYGKWSITDVRK